MSKARLPERPAATPPAPAELVPSTSAQASSWREYADEIDDQELWRAIEPESEPTDRAWFLPAALLLLVIGTPWYPLGELGTRMLAGLPVWAWISLASAAGLALLTAVASLRLWRDQQDGG